MLSAGRKTGRANWEAVNALAEEMASSVYKFLRETDSSILDLRTAACRRVYLVFLESIVTLMEQKISDLQIALSKKDAYTCENALILYNDLETGPQQDRISMRARDVFDKTEVKNFIYGKTDGKISLSHLFEISDNPQAISRMIESALSFAWNSFCQKESTSLQDLVLQSLKITWDQFGKTFDVSPFPQASLPDFYFVSRQKNGSVKRPVDTKIVWEAFAMAGHMVSTID